ncbi:MAG: glycoside hydrolase 100 family protein [Desulfobacterales bacterium]
MQLIGHRFDDLIGHIPAKVCYPAISGRQWEAMTGCDAKNTPWSYHNGGAWPFLLWQMAAASVAAGRDENCRQAIEIAEKRLEKDHWAEYYDGRTSRLPGRAARRHQTWTIAGYIAAKTILANPDNIAPLIFEYGEPLRKTLKNYRKLRVGDYRIVFRVEGNEIFVPGICHRREACLLMEKRRD